MKRNSSRNKTRGGRAGTGWIHPCQPRVGPFPFSSTIRTRVCVCVCLCVRVQRRRNWVTEDSIARVRDDARRKCNRRRCGRDACNYQQQQQQQQLFGCRQVKRKGSSKGTWPIFVPWHFSTALKNFFPLFSPPSLPIPRSRNEPMVIKTSKERDECTARKQCSPSASGPPVFQPRSTNPLFLPLPRDAPSPLSIAGSETIEI